jgi:hypothetical protein
MAPPRYRWQMIMQTIISNATTAEDHVWFEERWMVASLCDE